LGPERTQRVVLVRHGSTEWSEAGRHTGRTDVPLTKEGREQATALRVCLDPRRFAAVFTSPRSRARETATLAGFPEAAPLEDLGEWDYGDFEGLTTSEIRAERPRWFLWRDGVPGGETLGEVGARADRIAGLVRGIEGDVALFAHGHVLRILAARWLGLEPGRGRSFALSTGTISTLGYEREIPVIIEWNAACRPDPT
jgi:probable phosphoglycerate mutase